MLGVLFGLPRSSSSKNNTVDSGDDNSSLNNTSHNTRPYYSDNTNIEEISDWLTKILVGVGLVQLTQVGRYVSILQKQLKDTKNHAIFEVSLIILFGVWGFFLGYLSARLFLPTAFSRSLNIQLREKDKELEAKNEELEERKKEREINLKDRNLQQDFIAKSLNGQITDLYDSYQTQLSELDIDLLHQLKTDTNVLTIPENFRRDSKYHEQLRRLRQMSLIYPVQGGKWDTGKTIHLTAHGKKFLDWLSQSNQASIK